MEACGGSGGGGGGGAGVGCLIISGGCCLNVFGRRRCCDPAAGPLFSWMSASSSVSLKKSASSSFLSRLSSTASTATRPLASPTANLDLFGEKAPNETGPGQCNKSRTKGVAPELLCVRTFQTLTMPSDDPVYKRSGVWPQATNLTPVSSVEIRSPASSSRHSKHVS